MTFDQALENINNGLNPGKLSARVSARVVWVSEWHLPGCISESFSVCTSKREAIECALMFADSPRGMKTALQKFGRFDSNSPMFGRCINTVYKTKIGGLV